MNHLHHFLTSPQMPHFTPLFSSRLLFNSLEDRYLIGSAGNLELDDGGQLKTAPSEQENEKAFKEGSDALQEALQALGSIDQQTKAIEQQIQPLLQAPKSTRQGIAAILGRIKALQDQSIENEGASSQEYRRTKIEHDGKVQAHQMAEAALHQATLRKKDASSLLQTLFTDAQRLEEQQQTDARRAKLFGGGMKKVSGLAAMFTEDSGQSAEQEEKAPSSTDMLFQDSQTRREDEEHSQQNRIGLVSDMTGLDKNTILSLFSSKPEDLNNKIQELLKPQQAPDGTLAHDIQSLEATSTALNQEIHELQKKLQALKSDSESEAAQSQQRKQELKDLQQRLEGVEIHAEALRSQIQQLSELQESINGVKQTVADLMAPIMVAELPDELLQKLVEKHAHQQNARLCSGVLQAYTELKQQLTTGVGEYFSTVPVQADFAQREQTFKDALAQRQQAQPLDLREARTNPGTIVDQYFAVVPGSPTHVIDGLFQQAKTLLETYAGHILDQMEDPFAQRVLREEMVDPSLTEFSSARAVVDQQVRSYQGRFTKAVLESPKSLSDEQKREIRRLNDSQAATLQANLNMLDEQTVQDVLFEIFAMILPPEDLQTLNQLATDHPVKLSIDHIGRDEQLFSFTVQEANGSKQFLINGLSATEAVFAGEHPLVRLLQDFFTSLKAKEAIEQRWEFSVTKG